MLQRNTHAARGLVLALAMALVTAAACDAPSCGAQPARPEAPIASPSAMVPVAREPLVVLTEDAFTGAGALLPRPEQLDDWQYIEAPSYYRSEELADLLAGDASSFVSLGVEQAAFGSLRMAHAPDTDGQEVGLAIYIFRMSSPPAARQKWDDDHEASGCLQDDDLSVTHCLGPSGLDVLRGPYYLRFVLDAEDPALVDGLAETATLVLEHLTDGLRSARPVVAPQ